MNSGDSYVMIIAMLLVVVVLIVNWRQNRHVLQIASEAAKLLATNTTIANDKLDEIHALVNSRLHDALDTIEDLKALLLLALSSVVSVDDPRVIKAIEKRS